MKGFEKPKRNVQSGFNRFLYVDGDQVADSLSALEGGAIDEARGKSSEEANKGLELSGALGVSGVKAEGGGSRNRKLTYEEEVVRRRTGYSTITALLRQLRESGAIGRIGTYDEEVYEAIDEGDLYEFSAEIRMHPFHQAVDVTRSWDVANENLEQPLNTKKFAQMAANIERDFYGANKPRNAFAVFADIYDAPSEYKLAMSVKKEQLLVPLDEFSGRVTFVAQVHRKITQGRKYLAARLVRGTPILAPAEESLMLKLVPILQGLPGMQEEGIIVEVDDVVLRKPATILKPLCIYKG